MPWAMVPDAVDYDQLLSGERREGAFYGVWTFAIKVGQALALAMSGAVLSLSGYVANAVQSPDAILGIRILLGPIPAVVFTLAIVVLVFYPITAARYAEIRQQLEAREAS
jgi:GPH family glycoside/pentoside/hexuronide:cation symporter